MSDTIIIKRKKRGKGGGKGGGAWKVAFADFMLAMMTLFLVLWVLAVSDQTERSEFAESVRGYSLFESESNPFDLGRKPTPVNLGNDLSALDSKNRPDPRMMSISKKTARSLNQRTADQEGDNGSGDKPLLSSQLKGRLESPEQLSLLASELEAIADAVGAADNIEVEVVPQGLRILLRDDRNNKMFRRGNAQMTPFFQDVLRSLAPVFGSIENRIMISGHTDSSKFYNAAFTNWELSSQRALQARQMLEIGGMPKDRVAQVVAMADTMLIDPENPKASRNRRIELLLLTGQAEAAIKKLFSSKVTGSAVDQAFNEAQRNQPVLRSKVLLSDKVN